MRAFQHDQKAPHRAGPAKKPLNGRAGVVQRRDANAIAQLQRAIGNLSVQQILKAHAGLKDLGSSTTPQDRFGGNFIGIRMHPDAAASLRRKSDEGSAENVTVMPSRLRAKMESLSGVDLSDVRVHRNSPRPDRLNALAYTEGRDIYLGPAQEKHLSHEGWHAVQQKQGRVEPTRQTDGVSINDQPDLEREADQMASKVASRDFPGRTDVTTSDHSHSQRNPVAQRKIKITGLDKTKRNHFVTKINEGSVLKFELDASGFLKQKDPSKTSKEVYSTEIAAAIADAQTVILNLVSKDDTTFVDSFATGEVDYDDMKSMPFNAFRINLLHFVVERFAIANYEANKATASAADFAAAHKKGHEAEERQLKEWFPKKTIKYKGEGFVAASKVVDAAGNGSIDYEFDFTDVKQVYKQPIVAGATKENIISSKIIVVR